MERHVTVLPLHYGRAPRWLFEKMKRLVGPIAEIVVTEFGPLELLRRVSDPIWFQALGAVCGFDWHSSGLTTTLCFALKEAIRERSRDLGIAVCGGKGREALKTPLEIEKACEDLGVDLHSLTEVSRLCAKIDNSVLQDGHALYHHTFFFSKEGFWAVVQQGMDPLRGTARRYQWFHTDRFFWDPHTGITCEGRSDVLNLASTQSEASRASILYFLRENPDNMMNIWKGIHISMPKRHYITPADIDQERLFRVFRVVHESHPRDFKELIAIRGVGPRTIAALALVSELIYKTPPDFRDPARFAFAHGGKDGHPFPVDKAMYEETINFLKNCAQKARLGRTDKLSLLRRLSPL